MADVWYDTLVLHVPCYVGREAVGKATQKPNVAIYGVRKPTDGLGTSSPNALCSKPGEQTSAATCSFDSLL